MKARKWLVALIALVMACTMGIAFAACEPVKPSGDDGGEDIVKLTVTYYDGASIITTREVEYGDPAPEIEAPEKDAHNFLGWFADPLHSNEYDFDAPIYKNTNIYAYYTQYKVYAATFRDAIPGVDGTDTLRGAEHSELVIPAAPVWEGHDFLGWKGSDGTLKNPGEKILLEGELDLAFTASWAEYTFEHVTANAATCTHEGNPDYYTCSACGKHFTAEDHLHEVEDIVEQPTGHDYGDPVWHWEGTTATATFTCTKCEDEEGHEVTKEATVNEGVITKPATCTVNGDKTYTATVEFNGTHTNEHVEEGVVDATGHSYGDPTWNWEGLKATATFTCTKCEDEDGHEVEKEATVDGGRVTKEATCAEAGDMTYTATVEFNGTHKDEHVEVGAVEATGHTWEWKHDETSHWQECSVCHDARQNEHTHTYENGVCTEPNCGYTMIAVTFEDGETTETKYAHKGKTVEDWPTPAEKDHFRFDGWYKEGVEEPFTAESTFDEPVTLTAKWVETVTVTFKAWGSVKEDTEVTVDKGTSLGDQLLAPTSTGYIFDGWFNGDDKFEADTTVTADVELTAKAHINTALLDTRSYGVVGGNGTDDLSSRNNWTPANTEYFQFTRSTDEIYVSGTTVYTVYKFTMYFTASTQFKILYKASGNWGWNSEVNTCYELASVSGNLGTDKTGSVAKQSSGDKNLYVTKAGEYTLIIRVTKSGTPSLYYTYNGASGTKPTYGTQAYVRGDFNNWLNDYNWYEGFRTNTLPDTYKLKNEGGSWYVDVDVKEATVSKPAEFKVFGINNLTWYPESENIKDITSPGLWRITWSGSGSPSAKQIVEYDVTYSLGDGYAGTSELPAPETVSSLDDYKLTLPEAPVWENHRFEGWDVDGVTHRAGETVTITKSMTITAIWHELEEHTLTFKSWDEQALEGEQYAQKTYREDADVTLPAGPERAGFSFTGWKEQDGETTYTDGTMKMPGKDVTLIATYTEAKDITITWHVDGERKGASENLRSGMSFTRDMITGVDDKDGYTLDGWYTSEDYTERFNFGIVADDAGIYARFIRTTVTVTYADENGETLTTKEYSITVDGDVVTKYVTAETARYGKFYPNTTLEVWEVAANSWHLESATGTLYAGENLYDNTTLYGTLAEITTNRGVSSTAATHAKAIVVGGNDSPTSTKYWSSVAFSATITKYSSKDWNNNGTLKYQRDNTLNSNEIYTLRLRLAAGDNFRFVQQGTWTTVVKLANLAKSDTTYFTKQTPDTDGNLHVVKAGVYDFVFYFNKSGTPTVYYNYVSAVSSSVKNYLEFTAGDKKESDRIELTSNTPIDVEITDTISAAKVIYAYIGDGMCDIYNATAAAAKTFSGGEGKYSVKFVRSSATTGAGTLTITKYNTFTLDYDLSDGVGTKPGTFTTEVAATTYSYTIDADDPTMTGYRFMGWQLNGDETLYQKDGKVTLQPGANTLKAVFKQEFTVTYEKGDYPEAATHEWDVKASEKVLIDEGVDLPELPDPGVEGKTYSRKWVVGGVEHDAGEHIEVTADVTVTARYTELVDAEPVTVTWHILDLDGSEQTYTTEPMSGTQIAELVADAEGSYTSKEGHTLDGWYTENDYTADHKVDVWATAEKEHTYDFYARWYKTTVTVKFVIETPYSTSATVTGTDSDETKSATIAGLTGTVTAPAQPTKKYMTFAGWETKDEAKTKFTSDMHFLDDATFYATWTETANTSYQKDANYYYIYGHKSANTSSSLNKLTNWSATGKTLTFKRDESYKSHNVYYIDLTLYYGDTFQILHNGKAGYENGQMGFKYLDNTGKAFFSTNEEGWQADIIVAPKYDGEFHFTLSTDPTKMNDTTQFTPGTGASLEYTRTKAVTAATTSIDAFLIGDLVGSWEPATAKAKTGTHFFNDSSIGSNTYTLYYKFTAQKQFKITSGTSWTEINIGRINNKTLYAGGIWDIQDTNGKSNWSMLRDESNENLYLNAGYGGWYRVELHIGSSTSDPYYIKMYRLTTS